MGNIARSAGGENLWWISGNVGGGDWRNGGNDPGAVKWGREEASNLILSARARLYNWEKLRDSEAGAGLGGEAGAGGCWPGNTENGDNDDAREEGSEGGHDDGDDMLGGEDGDSALGMLSCAGNRILYPDLGGDCWNKNNFQNSV